MNIPPNEIQCHWCNKTLQAISHPLEDADGSFQLECPDAHATISIYEHNKISSYTLFHDLDNFRYKIVCTDYDGKPTTTLYEKSAKKKYSRAGYQVVIQIPFNLLTIENNVIRCDKLFRRLNKLGVFT